MSVRNLDALFRPKSVAIIGASERPGSIGAAVTRNALGVVDEKRLLLVICVRHCFFQGRTDRTYQSVRRPLLCEGLCHVGIMCSLTRRFRRVP